MNKNQKQEQHDIYIKFDEFEVPEFRKAFLGYDKIEVDRYLNALVDAYNKMHAEYQETLSKLEDYQRKKDAIAEAMIELKIAGESENSKVDSYSDEALEPPENALQLYEFSGSSSADFDEWLKDILSKSGGL